MGEDLNDLLATRRAHGDALAALQAENARLAALLESHGIEWRPQPEPVYELLRLSTDEKIALFRRLFRGRADVYPIRWES